LVFPCSLISFLHFFGHLLFCFMCYSQG
jgi:hypothetical protein